MSIRDSLRGYRGRVVRNLAEFSGEPRGAGSTVLNKATQSLLVIAAALLTASSASAAWGLRYQFYDGAQWTNHLNVSSANGPVNVKFRMSVWNDGTTQVDLYNTKNKLIGIGTAVQPLRLVVSSALANFGTKGNGDSIVSYKKDVNAGGVNALRVAQTEDITVLGYRNKPSSFFGNLVLDPKKASTWTPEMIYFHGEIKIGTKTESARNRTIELGMRSLGDPKPTGGNGGIYGASFYVKGKTPILGTVREAAVIDTATITVSNAQMRAIRSTEPALPGSGADVPTPGVLTPFALFMVRRRRR